MDSLRRPKLESTLISDKFVVIQSNTRHGFARNHVGYDLDCDEVAVNKVKIFISATGTLQPALDHVEINLKTMSPTS